MHDDGLAKRECYVYADSLTEFRIKLPDDRWLISWETSRPMLYERYLLKWEW